MQQPATTTTVIVPPAAAAPPAREGCSCSVPPNVSCHVRGARGCAITIIVVHGIHLLAFGFLSPIAWIASLIAFIMAGIHLCMFQKCTYICAGIFYILGFIVDIASVVIYGGSGVIILAVPAALGMIAFLLGAVFSLVAVCNWEVTGAPGTAGPPGPTVMQANAPNPSFQVTTTTQKSELPAYSGHTTAAPKSQPPPYSGNV